MDLSYLLERFGEDAISTGFKQLNTVLVDLLVDFGLVTFIPLNINDSTSLKNVSQHIDKASGYFYSSLTEYNETMAPPLGFNVTPDMLTPDVPLPAPADATMSRKPDVHPDMVMEEDEEDDDDGGEMVGAVDSEDDDGEWQTQ